MSAPRVLVAGGANVDVKVTASGPTAEGISTPGRVHVIPGGVARNVAEALARLGATVRLLTVVGADAWGEWLMTQTALAGVDTTAVIRDPGQTGFYVTIGGRGVAGATIGGGTPAGGWPGAPRGGTDLVGAAAARPGHQRDGRGRHGGRPRDVRPAARLVWGTATAAGRKGGQHDPRSMGECAPRGGNCIDRREGLMTPQSPFDVSDEIQVALGLGAAVVALESSVVTHGLPYPANLEAARRMERAIRQHGAVPAAG